jgi:hypothetical protein
VLDKMAPGVNPPSLEFDTKEIEEDLRTAALALPFFGR